MVQATELRNRRDGAAVGRGRHRSRDRRVSAWWAASEALPLACDRAMGKSIRDKAEEAANMPAMPHSSGEPSETKSKAPCSW